MLADRPKIFLVFGHDSPKKVLELNTALTLVVFEVSSMLQVGNSIQYSPITGHVVWIEFTPLNIYSKEFKTIEISDPTEFIEMLTFDMNNLAEEISVTYNFSKEMGEEIAVILLTKYHAIANTLT